MGFKRDPETGGWRWDKNTSGERWGKNANRPDFVEAAEFSIEHGMINCVWDTLADHRPDDLADAEERMIVRKALLRSVELGRLNSNLAAVLIRLIRGSDRLKTENRDVPLQRAIRAEIRSRPHITLGQLKLQFPNVPRSTLQAIRNAALSND